MSLMQTKANLTIQTWNLNLKKIVTSHGAALLHGYASMSNSPLYLTKTGKLDKITTNFFQTQKYKELLYKESVKTPAFMR